MGKIIKTIGGGYYKRRKKRLRVDDCKHKIWVDALEVVDESKGLFTPIKACLKCGKKLFGLE